MTLNFNRSFRVFTSLMLAQGALMNLSACSQFPIHREANKTEAALAPVKTSANNLKASTNSRTPASRSKFGQGLDAYLDQCHTDELKPALRELGLRSEGMLGYSMLADETMRQLIDANFGLQRYVIAEKSVQLAGILLGLRYFGGAIARGTIRTTVGGVKVVAIGAIARVGVTNALIGGGLAASSGGLVWKLAEGKVDAEKQKVVDALNAAEQDPLGMAGSAWHKAAETVVDLDKKYYEIEDTFAKTPASSIRPEDMQFINDLKGVIANYGPQSDKAPVSPDVVKIMIKSFISLRDKDLMSRLNNASTATEAIRAEEHASAWVRFRKSYLAWGSMDLARAMRDQEIAKSEIYGNEASVSLSLLGSMMTACQQNDALRTKLQEISAASTK